MTEYKSEVKKIYAPIGRVYERLADLNNLAVIQQGLDNPDAMERIKQQAGDKVKPEQLEQIVQKLRELQFDRDSVSGNTPIGTATLRIIEREPDKTIKFAAEGMPVRMVGGGAPASAFAAWPICGHTLWRQISS